MLSRSTSQWLHFLSNPHLRLTGHEIVSTLFLPGVVAQYLAVSISVGAGPVVLCAQAVAELVDEDVGRRLGGEGAVDDLEAIYVLTVFTLRQLWDG